MPTSYCFLTLAPPTTLPNLLTAAAQGLPNILYQQIDVSLITDSFQFAYCSQLCTA